MSATVVDFESYRSEQDHARLRRSAERQLQSPFGWHDEADRRVLNDRQVAHRRRMLEYCRHARTPVRSAP